jgi:biopolymer transport protein ExbD
MKFEQHEPDEIKLEMTSMIDIVFQLLVFFIMTFKVVAMEGDFNVRMPLASRSAELRDDEILPDLIQVRLRAGENGNISAIEADGNEIVGGSVEEMFGNLTQHIESRLAGAANPDEAKKTEVEFDIDYDLRYSHTVRGIEAVSGRKLSDGSVIKLIEKIKFKDNSQSGG